MADAGQVMSAPSGDTLRFLQTSAETATGLTSRRVSSTRCTTAAMMLCGSVGRRSPPFEQRSSLTRCGGCLRNVRAAYDACCGLP